MTQRQQQMPNSARRTKTNPWEKAKKKALIRGSTSDIYGGLLEPGVNFFVLMLEQLGAVTYFSCEGHPTGFYIMFRASYALAQKIKSCGYFRVEIEGKNYWSIRMREYVTEADRVTILTEAAKSWEEVLGPLQVTKTNRRKRRRTCSRR